MILTSPTPGHALTAKGNRNSQHLSHAPYHVLLDPVTDTRLLRPTHAAAPVALSATSSNMNRPDGSTATRHAQTEEESTYSERQQTTVGPPKLGQPPTGLLRGLAVSLALSNAALGPCAGPAPFRTSSGLPMQQNPQARNSQMGTGRVTNGKLGSGSNWNFTMPTGAPGLSNVRAGNAGAASAMASFGQSMSGSQAAAAIDLSDFPSLSGAPQAQHQNPGQAIWAQRPTQQSQAQRQQQEAHDAPPQGLRQNQPQPQSSNDDSFPSGNQFTSGLDDFRPRGQGSGDQPQTGSIDEFPPLGRDSSIAMGNRESSLELGSERRGSLLQNTGFGAYTNGMAFAGMGQQRNPLANPNLMTRSQEQSRITSPATQGMGSLSSSRSPLPHGQNGTIGQDKPVGAIGTAAHRGSASAAMDPQRHVRQYTYGSQPFSSDGDNSHIASGAGAFGNSDVVESPAASQDLQSLDQMSEADRFGFAGLMAKFQDPVQRQWVIGQELAALDTRANSSEPMYQSWTTPFTPNAPPSRPLESDYTLPDCYNVANVTPLRERISGFTEETLFYIFYSMPRDLMQVLVAEELIGRRWRYHKGEKQWLTRDESHELPREVDPGVSEIGYYLWWDEKQWKKIRKQHLLRYEDLENDGENGLVQHAAAMSNMGMTRTGGGGLGAAMGSGNGFGAMATNAGGGLMGLGRGL